MSYVNYRAELYRTGFRPYGHTDPFAASQLNGLSGDGDGLGQVHPFGPWQLHGDGMGQYHPFTERGGWALHGLGAMVPTGSLVTYQGTWQQDLVTSPQNILLAVVDSLNKAGLSVRNSAIASSGVASYVGLEESYQVTLQLQVNDQGHASPDDIIAIIRHYVFDASGYFPLADSIPAVQVPSAPAPTATGQPQVDGAPVIWSEKPSGMPSWGTWLENNFGLIAMGVVGLVVLPMISGRRNAG